ncbi:MAG: XRE family transcriptional regulator [Sporichthyaceae bacterium]|nr:XRE family transcriptional regulator [Sporichthyaceae bacterium]
MASLGVVLKLLRDESGLTQEELASRSGLSARSVSDIERGLRRRLYADTAHRLADALSLSGAQRDGFVAAARGRAMPRPDPPALPLPLNRLVGRVDELASLGDALSPGNRRLVTITGLGGAGKTRLALEVAHGLLSAYDGRVRLLRITPEQDPDRLVDLVGTAVGALPGGGSQAVAAAVGSRPMLVVVDAFEHVLPAAPALEAVLATAGGLHSLVTSRVRLHIPGEHELALGPLPAQEARELFVDQGAGRLADSDSGLVGEICNLVSGLPLAIELVAAVGRQLPLRNLRDELAVGTARLDPALRDAVGWSIASATPAERDALTAAASFPAGWRLDGLAALVERQDLLALLRGLSDRSLVTDADDGTSPRWRMLDVVREHVLGSQPVIPEARRSAYVQYHLELLEGVQTLVGHERDWYAQLQAEEPNIEVALRWATDDADLLLRLATAMWQYWQSRGELATGRRWLERGLALQPAADSSTRATALWGLAWIAYHQGDDPTVTAAADELRRLAEARGDGAVRRNAATMDGILAIARSRPTEALTHLEAALELARRVDRPWILAASLLNLGLGSLAAGDPDRARKLLAEALRRFDALGDQRFHARCLGYLGIAALLQQDTSRASSLFTRSLNVFDRLGEPGGTAEGLEGLAAVAAAEGHPEKAAMLAGATQRLRETFAARALPVESRILGQRIDAAAATVPPEDWATAARWFRPTKRSLAPLAPVFHESVRGGVWALVAV